MHRGSYENLSEVDVVSAPKGFLKEQYSRDKAQSVMHGELNSDLNENQEEKKSKNNVIRLAKIPGNISSFNIKKLSQQTSSHSVSWVDHKSEIFN